VQVGSIPPPPPTARSTFTRGCFGQLRFGLSKIETASGTNAGREELYELEARAQTLPGDRQGEVMERLRLAREFIGTRNPLDFLLSWRTPLERCAPLALRTLATVSIERDDEDGDDDAECDWT